MTPSQVRVAWHWHSRAGPGSDSWQGHQRESGRKQESVPRGRRKHPALGGGGNEGLLVRGSQSISVPFWCCWVYLDVINGD